MAETFLKVGLCSWQSSQEKYYQNFDLIEIDSTFYKLPMTKTAQRWRDQAPEGFTYTMKALQIITHEPYSPTYEKGGLNIPGPRWKEYGSFRPTAPVFEAWEQTREIASILKSPIVVFQCPTQFNPTPQHIANLREFFTQIERGAIRCAWEPRGTDWKVEQVRELCAELDLIHCVDPFLNLPAYGTPRYYRLHGSADYTYQFTDADLELIKTFVRDQPVYCLFNNVHMWEDAARFKELMGMRSEPAG